MFTGMMIDDLINTVEKAEFQACTYPAPAVQEPSRKPTLPGVSPYMYDFAILNMAVVGVA